MVLKSQTQQKNLEGKKKKHQLSVRVQSPEKIYLQLTNDSPSVVHHQDDEILQADDNLNKSHEFVGLPCQDIKATCKKKRQLSVCEIIEPAKKLAFNQLVILFQSCSSSRR
ncbi:hypothetical protein TNCV_5135661 [Trichonephila clavipes]|nr:hypothetical protein TNCV_5135661 [Trichonephila clavipes]